jgi:hypothetical protein
MEMDWSACNAMQAMYLQCVRGTWLATMVGRYAGMPPTFLFAAPTGGDSYLAPRAIHITPSPLPLPLSHPRSTPTPHLAAAAVSEHVYLYKPLLSSI